MISARFPSDPYIDFTRGETMKALDRYWRDAFAAGRRFDAGGQAGTQFLLGHIATAELLELIDERAVCEELVRRPGVEEEARREAIASLARLRNESVTQVLLATMQQMDQTTSENSVIFDLGRLLTAQSRDQLCNHRALLRRLATEAALSSTRQIGFVALIVADGNADQAWELVDGNGQTMLDLVRAMPLVVDPNVRAEMYSNVARLLDEELPKAMHGQTKEIRRAAMTALTYVRGKEPETFDRVARFIRQGVDRTAAMGALQRIPVRYWPAEQAAPLLNELVDFIQALPEAERNTPAALAALRLGDALASLLPPPEAERARTRLGDLGIRSIRLGTLPHRMAYDQERLAVEAGETVEILFENADLMPHNFVITAPGTLQSVGMLAESTAQQPGAFERHYVPRSDSILLSSSLLFSNESQQLNFTAPQTPGVYPFVCTYPGHWRRMHGALYVVPDLDAYRSDPESYLADHPLPIKDELLLRSRPRKAWMYDDFAELLDESFHGRSFGNAKQMFEVANCVACHRLNNAGHEVGPDLAKLDPKLSARDILRELLEPSKKINDKYYSYSFVLNSGKTVTGLVLKETPQEVQLIENPLARSDPVVLKQSEIDARMKSPVSIMPEGLLDKLTREEVLDLLAYVVAGGSEHSPVFGDEHHHSAGSE